MNLDRRSDDFIATIRTRLYTAVLSDVLDELGYRNQALPAHIRPLDESLNMAGFARTGIYREVYRVVPDENPYELEIALVDDLKRDDVAVLGCGGSTRIAPWGELLTTASRARGAAGCLTDGFVRDTRLVYLKDDHRWNTLRQQPRFVALLRQMKLDRYGEGTPAN